MGLYSHLVSRVAIPSATAYYPDRYSFLPGSYRGVIEELPGSYRGYPSLLLLPSSYKGSLLVHYRLTTHPLLLTNDLLTIDYFLLLLIKIFFQLFFLFPCAYISK